MIHLMVRMKASYAINSLHLIILIGLSKYPPNVQFTLVMTVHFNATILCFFRY